MAQLIKNQKQAEKNDRIFHYTRPFEGALFQMIRTIQNENISNKIITIRSMI